VELGFARRTTGAEREAWLRRAADAGQVEAAEELALLLLDEGEDPSALLYLEAVAEGGSRTAAGHLGRIHRWRAEVWLSRAVEAGDVTAIHALGELVAGTPGREHEAMRWHRKAAEEAKYRPQSPSANCCMARAVRETPNCGTGALPRQVTCRVRITWGFCSSGGAARTTRRWRNCSSGLSRAGTPKHRLCLPNSSSGRAARQRHTAMWRSRGRRSGTSGSCVSGSGP
jgi:hypothetical protein